MKKKYPVILSDTERAELKSLIAAGTAPARKLTHARILLRADHSSEDPGWVGEQIADAVEVSHRAERATRGDQTWLMRYFLSA